ncbi:MAG: zinc ribbon domain-containing protein [Planctomycetota bacterium]|jgi:hypothetical protein
MSKKFIVIIAAGGLASFAAAFSIALLTQKTVPVSQQSGLDGSTVAGGVATNLMGAQPGVTAGEGVGNIGLTMKGAITEKQLKTLVYDIQEKMKEYNEKLRQLQTREQRLEITQDLIKADIEELNNLRVELASTVARLKSERDKLINSRVEIAKAEKTNLMSTAATYDKMPSASAGKILVSLSKMQTSGGGINLDDPARILHYMTERTRAKLLAELATSEPKFAAALCQRLKQIVEKE